MFQSINIIVNLRSLGLKLSLLLLPDFIWNIPFQQTCPPLGNCLFSYLMPLFSKCYTVDSTNKGLKCKGPLRIFFNRKYYSTTQSLVGWFCGWSTRIQRVDLYLNFPLRRWSVTLTPHWWRVNCNSKMWVVSEGSFLTWMNQSVSHRVFVKHLLETTHLGAVGNLGERYTL